MHLKKESKHSLLPDSYQKESNERDGVPYLLLMKVCGKQTGRNGTVPGTQDTCCLMYPTACGTACPYSLSLLLIQNSKSGLSKSGVKRESNIKFCSKMSDCLSRHVDDERLPVFATGHSGVTCPSSTQTFLSLRASQTLKHT